jgi:hypothetical protein
MFLLPLVLTFVLLREAIRYTAKAVKPMVRLIPTQAVGGVAMTDIKYSANVQLVRLQTVDRRAKRNRDVSVIDNTFGG